MATRQIRPEAYLTLVENIDTADVFGAEVASRKDCHSVEVVVHNGGDVVSSHVVRGTETVARSRNHDKTNALG